MVYLLLSISFSVLILMVFRAFELYKIDVFNAIVVSYVVSVATGWLFIDSITLDEILERPWFYYTILLGFWFILGFYFIGRCVQVFGVTVTTVAQRMSMILPVTYGILVYHEVANFYKITGVLLAILAVVLTNLPIKTTTTNNQKITWWLYTFPVLLLLLSGSTEIIFQYLQRSYFQASGEELLFTILIFFFAGLMGFGVFAIQAIQHRFQITKQDGIGAIALGLLNLAAVYCVLKVLGEGWEGSVVFPINNVGVIVGASIVAYLIFKDTLSKLNIVGVGVAILAIVLIGLA